LKKAAAFERAFLTIRYLIKDESDLFWADGPATPPGRRTGTFEGFVADLRELAGGTYKNGKFKFPAIGASGRVNSLLTSRVARVNKVLAVGDNDRILKSSASGLYYTPHEPRKEEAEEAPSELEVFQERLLDIIDELLHPFDAERLVNAIADVPTED